MGDPTLQADETIEAETPIAALVLWLCGESYEDNAWLRCTADDCKKLIAKQWTPQHPWVDFESSDGNWDASGLSFEENSGYMAGSACTGEYRYHVNVQPISMEEIASVRVGRVEAVSVEGLLEIVHHARDGLFLDLVDGNEFYNLDKPVSGADYIQHMTDVLAKYGLVPERESHERKDTSLDESG